MSRNTGQSASVPIAHRAFRNFSFLTSGKLLGDLFMFAMFVAISRRFGQAGIGEYSFAMAVTSFLMIFADFGLTNRSILVMSRDGGNILKHYSEALALRAWLITIALSALFLFANFFSLSERGYYIMLLVGAYQILYTLIDAAGSIFIATEKMHVRGMLDFTTRAIASIVCIAIIIGTDELVTALAALPLVVLLQIGIAHYLVVRRFGRPSFYAPLRDSYSLVKESASYGAHAFLQQLAVRIDIVLLGLLIGSVAVGLYNAAYRFLFILLFVPHLATVTIFPLASRLHDNSTQELGSLFRTAINLTVMLGLPTAAGLWLIAGDLIDLVFGDEFAESTLILRILTVVLFLSFLNRVAGIFLTATNEQHLRAKFQGLCALVYLIANLGLIPVLGPLGAAIAAIIAESVLAVLIFFRLQTSVPNRLDLSRIGIASIGIIAFCWPFSVCIHLPMPLTIVLSAAIYLAVISLFGTIRKNELDLALRILRRRPVTE